MRGCGVATSRRWRHERGEDGAQGVFDEGRCRSGIGRSCTLRGRARCAGGSWPGVRRHRSRAARSGRLRSRRDHRSRPQPGDRVVRGRDGRGRAAHVRPVPGGGVRRERRRRRRDGLDRPDHDAPHRSQRQHRAVQVLGAGRPAARHAEELGLDRPSRRLLRHRHRRGGRVHGRERRAQDAGGTVHADRWARRPDRRSSTSRRPGAATSSSSATRTGWRTRDRASSRSGHRS